MTQLPLFRTAATIASPCCEGQRAVLEPAYRTTSGCLQQPWRCACGGAGHWSTRASSAPTTPRSAP